MDAILTVVSKVMVMLIMIVVGYLVTKRGMLTEWGASEITSLLIQIVTPCLIVNSFLTSEDSLTAQELLLSVGTSALAIALSIGLSLCFFRKEPVERKKVLRFAVDFSNAGFMGLPLVEGIVGSKGVMYGSFFIVVFNIFCWTYGFRMMSGGQKMSWKVLLFNPGIVGLVFALPIYFLDLHLPPVISELRRAEHPLGHADHRQLCGQSGHLLLCVGQGGVQNGGPAAAGRARTLPAVAAAHPPRAGTAGHQRDPGGLPGGGQHGAFCRAVQVRLPLGLQNRCSEHRAVHPHHPPVHHPGPGGCPMAVLKSVLSAGTCMGNPLGFPIFLDRRPMLGKSLVGR